jgi:dUTP pyrophosphatase
MNIPNTVDNNGNSNPTGLLNLLLNMYDKVMVLKVFVDSDDDQLRDMYRNAALAHNNKLLTNPSYIDAGFDLFAPGSGQYVLDSIEFFGAGWPGKIPVNKLDFKICCAARMHADTGKNFNTGYYMHPRSSLSKTQLRLANSTGIVDAGYRGHLIGMFDVVNIPPNSPSGRVSDYSGMKYDRYLQICAPGLVPIIVEIVDTLSALGGETERGAGGFGSTGR